MNQLTPTYLIGLARRDETTYPGVIFQEIVITTYVEIVCKGLELHKLMVPHTLI
jgi:hypothetical protein